MQHACDAIAAGEMKQQDLVDRVTRSFTLLMDAGLFDPLEVQEYTKIPFDTINSDEAQASMLSAARQSPVLLKNGDTKAVLPLKKGVKLALIGPHTQTQKDLAGNCKPHSTSEGSSLSACFAVSADTHLSPQTSPTSASALAPAQPACRSSGPRLTRSTLAPGTRRSSRAAT